MHVCGYTKCQHLNKSLKRQSDDFLNLSMLSSNRGMFLSDLTKMSPASLAVVSALIQLTLSYCLLIEGTGVDRCTPVGVLFLNSLV